MACHEQGRIYPAESNGAGGGSQTRVFCLEGKYTNRYTTPACAEASTGKPAKCFKTEVIVLQIV